MGLVEDDGVVLGQDAAARGNVGEVERVVCDHEVRLGCALARRLREAGGDERAAAARAAVSADRELRPERLGRLDLELRPVARLGLVEPALHRLPGPPVPAFGKQERLEALERPAAEVVLPALQHRHGQLPPERRGGDRHVFGEKLFL